MNPVGSHMTPQDFADYLVRLAMEAYDFVHPHMAPQLRAEYQASTRERMAQAAQVYACEIATPRHAEPAYITRTLREIKAGGS